MKSQYLLMGERLRELRSILNISVSEMARITGVSEEDYLAHESGTTDSSFTFIMRCAERFGVDLSSLVTGDSPTLSQYHLTRANGGMPIKRRAGFEYRHLAPLLKQRHAEPFVVKAPAQNENDNIALSTHSGQEFDMVLKGKLKVQIGDKTEVMNPGDSIMYDSSLPHGMIAIGDEVCEFLAVVIRSEGDAPDAVEPKATEAVQQQSNDLIYSRFMSEELDADGHLVGVKFHYPENFNFAYDVIDELAKKTPNKLALLYIDRNMQEKRFTFKDISRNSCKAANYLYSLGIRRGDRVMLVLKRHYQFWAILPALHRIGAIGVPASNQLQTKDFVYRFERGEIKAIIHSSDDGLPEFIDEACKSCPNVKLRISVGECRFGEHDYNAEVEKFSDEFARPPELRALDTALMFFSSGTTGYPKMIDHSYTYPLGHIITARWWHNVRPDGLHFSISDTGWGKAYWGKIYGQWLCETSILVYDFDRFHAPEILKLINDVKVTTFCAPPTMYRFFIREDLGKYDLSSIKYATTAGEALNPEVFNIFQKHTGLKIMEGFGQTESTMIIGNLIGTTPKLGSMGKASPLYNVVLLDRDDQPVENGEVGEICIKTRRNEICGLVQEYFRDDEANAKCWKNGYYHTGDTAWRDEDGYYFYVGRSDDLIKSSGYRIGPFEVESVMMELPYVLECAVVGVPDEIRGQLVKAFVVLTKGTQPSDKLVKEIQEYVKHHTAPYKYPRAVEFLEVMPKTTSGKIQRDKLRKLY